MVKLKELEGWLTSGEAAKVLGRTKPGTINLARRGEVRSVKTRAGWLYDPRSVAQFTETRRTEGKERAPG